MDNHYSITKVNGENVICLGYTFPVQKKMYDFLPKHYY